MTERNDRKARELRRVIHWVGLALLVSVVVREMRKPPEERTWTGTVARFVPYDLRMPTSDRFRDRLWNPEGPVVGPRVFGVGWTVNFGRIARAVQERLGA